MMLSDESQNSQTILAFYLYIGISIVQINFMNSTLLLAEEVSTWITTGTISSTPVAE